MKKILSIFICMAMILSIAPALASEQAENVLAGIVITENEKKVDTTGATVTATDTHTSFGEPSAMLDGVGMVGTKAVDADGNITETELAEGIAAANVQNANRWVATAGATPTVTIDFGKDVAFDTIRFTEARRIVGKYKITWYDDGTACTAPFEGEFTETASSGADNYLYLKEISLGQTVKADKIDFEIVSVQRNGSYVLSITEMEFLPPSNEAKILDENGVKLDAVESTSADMFDNDATSVCKVDVTDLTEATVCFSLSKLVTGESLKIDSNDFTSVTLYGSVDGEKYFEIPHQMTDGVCKFNAPELLSAVKVQLTLAEGTDMLEIAEIEMYYTENAEFEELTGMFMKTDISSITDDSLDALESIKNPLPETFGSYTIEWMSSDNDVLNPDTGVVTKSYVKQYVTLTASFKRNGVTYKENMYNITVNEDLSQLPELPESIYSYSADKINLAGHIISSSAFCFGEDGNAITNTAGGNVSTLYDENSKTQGFSNDNTNSWLTYEYNTDTFREKYPLPYTLQFDFDEIIPLNTISIWESRNRLEVIDVRFSVDGKNWDYATQDAYIKHPTHGLNTTTLVEKSVSFPTVYAKNVQIVIKQVTETSQSAAIKISEIVFLNEQQQPILDGTETSYISDSNVETYAEISENSSIVVDMGKIVGFDTLKWMNTGAAVKEYAISVSNNAQSWHQIKTGHLSEATDILTTLDLGAYSVARYVKLDIKSLHSVGNAKICELYFSEESSYSEYRTEKNFLSLIAKDETDILVEEALTLLTADELDAIVETVDFYSLAWDFTNAPMINPETKEVTHTGEDNVGKIGVSVLDENIGGVIYLNEFDVVAKAAFDDSSYYTATEETAVASGSYDLKRPEEFLFNQENMIVEFSVNDSETGKVILNSDDELIDINFSETEIIINYKERTKILKRDAGMSFRVIFNKDKFEFYTKTGTEPFRGIIAEGAYKNDVSNGIKSIDTEIGLSDVKMKIHKKCLGEFLNQLNFSHISNENMYQVTSVISFIEEIIGLDVEWTSNDNNIINSQTGVVNTASEPSYVELTASVNESGVVNWSKTLYVTVNMENIISEGVLSTNTVAYQGNVFANLSDTDIDTSFVTNYKNGYNIKITFPKNTPISQIAMIEDNDEGSIDEFDIYVDGTLVYEGEKVNGFTNCLLDSVMGKEIKIDIKKTTGITGFKEISVHSELSDVQKAASDLAGVTIATSYANGTYTFPKTGAYGSVLSYSADKSIVSFTESGDSVTMTVNNESVDTSVVITVNAVSNGKPAKPKTQSIIAKGKQSVSYDPPSGGSGGSGGGGGGGNYAPTGTVPSNAPVSNTPDELSGHWAEKEIRELVNKGVVQGNGSGLNLGGTVTRAEFLTMLARVLETPLSENAPVFNDVKSGDWFANVVQTAFEKGWIEGYNNNASPNAYITREEMVKIICCALEITFDENTPAAEFTDGDMQSEWAVSYISALSLKNIINGYEDGSFRPKNNLKRDEAMIVIYRICNMEVE